MTPSPPKKIKKISRPFLNIPIDNKIYKQIISIKFLHLKKIKIKVPLPPAILLMNTKPSLV